ncbi:MAG: cell division protein FtsW [Candidatus Colwellbacteria bacterium]|nr:cell division protein FtsW [Candidatus Colwellbacteria bacterium]
MVKSRRGKPDYLILLVAGLLILMGFVALASASSDLGKTKFDDAYYYLKHQALYGFIPGVFGFLIGYFINYRFLKKWATLILLGALLLLLLVFSPFGFTSGGAQRWIDLGPVTIQPSEILKIAFVIYLAAWLSSAKGDRQKSLHESFLPFIAISGFIGIILLIQKSTSAAFILLGVAFVLYMVGGAKLRYLGALALMGVLLFGASIALTGYRLERIKTFISGEGQSYHIEQAKIVIGSGGITGVGYGQSLSKAYLPERIGDSIFAIIAEEFGLIGSLVIIFLFFALSLRSFILARRARDQFGRLILVGFGLIIGLQAFIHIAANSGLIPLTGVPLPFISYGGTALVVSMTMIGLMSNISRNI